MRQALPLEYGLKSGDAIQLVSARSVGGAEFFTYADDRLGRYAEILGFAIRQPYVNQRRLRLP